MGYPIDPTQPIENQAKKFVGAVAVGSDGSLYPITIDEVTGAIKTSATFSGTVNLQPPGGSVADEDGVGIWVSNDGGTTYFVVKGNANGSIFGVDELPTAGIVEIMTANGSANQVPPNQIHKEITLSARVGNSLPMYYSFSAGLTGASNGIELMPGESKDIKVDNTDMIYVIGTASDVMEVSGG